MHGSSAASWTAVLLALLGITIGGIALVPNPNWIVFTVGCVIAAIAGPVGLVMSMAGKGSHDHGAGSAQEHGERADIEQH